MNAPRAASDKIRLVAWCGITLLGAAQAWATRDSMSPDGVSYLDIADAYARGDWQAAVNRLWSPLYPALIAAAWRVLRPAASWEFASVHLVNFAVFLGTLASFEFFLTSFVRYHRHLTAMLPSAQKQWPEWAMRVLGYGLFTYSSLELNNVMAITPDLCVAAIVYLASGLLLRIALRPDGTFAFPLLGVVLGIGYLAKAPMFPIAFVFLTLGAVIICRHGLRFAALLRIAAGMLGFAIVVSVLMVAFFETTGHPTLGESGMLNYAWLVNGLPWVNWQGDSPASGRPVHPTRKIFSTPPVYEFATPIGGTYPPWHDPAYWYEGVRVHFDPVEQQRTIVASMRVLRNSFLRREASLLVGGALLLLLGRGTQRFARSLSCYGPTLVPAVAAVGMFSLIELLPRFVGAFVTIFWLSLFAAVPWRLDRDQRLLGAILGGMIAVLMLSTLAYPDAALSRTVGALRTQTARKQWVIAQGLQQMGIRPGDKVAVIGYSFGAYWARLSKVRIVAEMQSCPYEHDCTKGQPDGITAFLAISPGTRKEILGVLARTGARVVVIDLEGRRPLPGWRKMANTESYALELLHRP